MKLEGLGWVGWSGVWLVEESQQLRGWKSCAVMAAAHQQTNTTIPIQQRRRKRTKRNQWNEVNLLLEQLVVKAINERQWNWWVKWGPNQRAVSEINQFHFSSPAARDEEMELNDWFLLCCLALLLFNEIISFEKKERAAGRQNKQSLLLLAHSFMRMRRREIGFVFLSCLWRRRLL